MSMKDFHMSVVVLNTFRNRYYMEGNETENGIVANSIDDILPDFIRMFRKEQYAHWIKVGANDNKVYYKCSVCDTENSKMTKYCPECGTTMEEETKNG